MAFQAGRQASYERALRALGAYLDREAKGKFKLIEVPEGFTLILQRGSSRPELHELHFPTATLMEQADQLPRNRKLLGSRYQSGWSVSPTGHQDFLRALGHELDGSQARTIVLDELECDVLVTYSYLDPGHGYQWRKHMIMVDRNQIAAMIKAARGRRHKRLPLKR